MEPHTVVFFFLMSSQLLSDKGDYKEAMEVLKKALKLEPTTKVRSQYVGGPDHHTHQP